MHEIQKEILSPSWWIAVVLVGLILNIASAYLKSFLDVLPSRFFILWTSYSRKARQQRDEMADWLRGNKNAQLHVLVEEARCRHRMLVYLVVETWLFGARIAVEIMTRISPATHSQAWEGTVLSAMCTIVIFLALWEFRAAMRYAYLVRQAQPKPPHHF